MIPAKRALERVTASDLFLPMWDYGWSSDIGGLAILDGTGVHDPDGRLRIDAVEVISARDCTWYPASGRCSVVRGWAWAGHWGSTPHPSMSPIASGSSRSPSWRRSPVAARLPAAGAGSA